MDNIFSLDDFKRWMKQQTGFATNLPSSYVIGATVDSGIPKSKLAPKMCVREGNLEELVKDFVKTGGKIIDIDGKHLVIETTSGSFSIPKVCIRRR
ncbi:MAG: hypothetical protein M0R80_08680 [Proteobacteria bacterium]|jgi:hypothetical protein|nr:hypothetical protein [Pseudomonadota bacterium]